MIAAFALALLAFAQEPAPIAPAQRKAHDLALAVDPRSLPRASAGHWKDFDPARIDASVLPKALALVKPALAARDVPAALEALVLTLREAPDFPPAWHQLGVLYFRLQRYGDAAAAFERYLEAAPARVGDTRALGHAYYSLGRYADAKSHYARVIEAAKEDVEARRGLALSTLKLGDAEGALALLRDVVEREPKHREAWTWIAHVLCDAEAAEEALSAATKARDLDPFEPRPWFLLGRIHRDLGRDAEALAAEQRFEALSIADQEARTLEAWLEYDPRELRHLLRLVAIHRGTGNAARARDALERALTVTPDDRGLGLLALDVLESVGDGVGARAAAEALERRFEDDALVWKRLELYFAKLRDRPNQMRAGERRRRLESGG